jgi:hypothetical protein
MTDVDQVVAVSMRADTGTPLPSGMFVIALPTIQPIGIALNAVLRIVGAIMVVAIRRVRRRFSLGGCGGF